MVICVTCKINSICTACIDFKLDQIDCEEIQFECPGCSIKKDKKGKYVRDLHKCMLSNNANAYCRLSKSKEVPLQDNTGPQLLLHQSQLFRYTWKG